jgi:hypothetical protein
VTKHHAMNAYRRDGTPWTLGDKQSTSRKSRLNIRVNIPELGGTTAVLDVVVKCPSALPGNRTPAVPYEYRHINNVIPLWNLPSRNKITPRNLAEIQARYLPKTRQALYR